MKLRLVTHWRDGSKYYLAKYVVNSVRYEVEYTKVRLNAKRFRRDTANALVVQLNDFNLAKSKAPLHEVELL